MDGQMTIWEYFDPPSDNPLDSIPEAEMVERIGLALGITFRWDAYAERWKANCGGGITADVHYSRWNTGDERQGRRMISCGLDYKTGGVGSGIDTIPGAITFIGSTLEKWRAKNDREK